MPTPRINWILFILYAAASAAIFTFAMLSPQVRGMAYAPLRELVLPKPKPIEISLLYSTEKEAWLQEVIPAFETGNYTVNGRPVKVNLEKMGSREVYLAVLEGQRQPTLISPASSLQIAILQDLSAGQFGRPIVNLADRAACQSVVTTPLVLVAWRDRAEILWGSAPGQNFWQDLQTALVDPQGWSRYNHPEWGYLKFGHTDPLRSNSGFMTILLMSYAYYEKTSGLTSGDILSNPKFQQWFTEFEGTIGQFDYSTGPLMERMVAYGPSVFDIVAVYEATAIEQAENAVGRYGELRVYYPPATVWSDHPFCTLSADWVTSEQADAAALFVEYLLSKPVQEIAFLQHGFRPVEPTIPLVQPGSPFERYAANGFQSDLSALPVVEVPSGDALNTLLEFWSRNVNP
jgi:ABC-type Fe3+ transport system substrate-binding protein